METLWKSSLALCLLFGLSNGMQCMDDDNNPVDWFVIYKVPKKASTKSEIHEGTAYLHRTSRAYGMSWTLSEKDVTMQDSALGNTLSPLYNEFVARESIWIIYNDDDPTRIRTKSRLVLGKGVLMVDGRQGFWMVHSVPKFPALPRNSDRKQDFHKFGGRYEFPDSGKKKGQMFLCISIPADQLDVISHQLWTNKIFINRKNVPMNLMNLYPHIAMLAYGTVSKRPQPTRIAEIHSINNYTFRSFASSTAWQGDLWDDLVGPSLKTHLWVMTDHKITNILPPKCKGDFTVEGIEKIQLQEANLTLTCGSDASKWAISPGGSWFCFGDVNRVSTELKMGGGAVCLQARDLSVIFRRMILDVKKCPPRVTQAPLRNSVDQSGAKRMRPSPVRQPHN